MRLSLQMCAQPEQSPTPLWLKLGPSSSAGTILCSCKGDYLGHHCLSTDNEGTAADPCFGKFRWVLVPAGRSSEYWISNAAFGGALYVSDHSFHSEGQTMKSVYVWTDPEKAPPLDRQLWQVQEKGNDEFHVVSKFNDQVLCVSSVAANTKGDRWVGVADKSIATPESYTLSMRLLEVGS